MKLFGIITFLLVPIFIWPQDIQNVWTEYIQSESELSETLAKEQLILEQLEILQNEMTILRKNKSWFNGWINELILHRKSDRQVELNDSLKALQNKEQKLLMERDRKFLTLKTVYRKLLESGVSDTLSVEDRQRTFSIGRWIVGKGLTPVDLPDYSSILTNPYEDDQIRQLIFEDLLLVIGKKITLIDFIILEWRSEQELMNRLEEFHRDLGLALESDRDLGSGGSQEFATEEPGMGSFDYATDGSIVTDMGNFFSERSSSEKRPLGSSLLENQITPEIIRSSSIGSSTIENNINFLKYKRQHYQTLIVQIEKELAQ
ncbi:MAG: hypothetical protein IIB44_08565 [Candidatus Marinimicrobia bacterium]|nr:hypothetical protein [Candidatus Neomarinimicrobiota bacterium]